MRRAVGPRSDPRGVTSTGHCLSGAVLAWLGLTLLAIPVLAGPRAPHPPGPSAGLPRPFAAADLEGGGVNGSSAPDLLDYWLGPVLVSQDLLARDLVLLLVDRVVVTRVRGGSVEQLNEQTVARLSHPPAGVARRQTRLSLVLPPEFAPGQPLLRLLVQGVDEAVTEVQVDPPHRSQLFLHAALRYRSGGPEQRLLLSGADPDSLLLEGFSRLHPATSPPGL